MELSDLLQKICCNQPANILRFGFMTVLVLRSEVIIEERFILCAVFFGNYIPPCSTNLSVFFFFSSHDRVFGVFKGYRVFGMFKGECIPYT